MFVPIQLRDEDFTADKSERIAATLLRELCRITNSRRSARAVRVGADSARRAAFEASVPSDYDSRAFTMLLVLRSLPKYLGPNADRVLYFAVVEDRSIPSICADYALSRTQAKSLIEAAAILFARDCATRGITVERERDKAA